MKSFRLLIVILGLLLTGTTLASAEILALINYESKPNQPVRREGIAIMDIDPESGEFGKILMDIPLPSDLVAHHIFFNRDRSKAYVTALGKSLLHVIDLTKFPYRLRAINVPDCLAGEDLVVSEDNKTWYLTCMGSSNVIVGDAWADAIVLTVPDEAAVIHACGVIRDINPKIFIAARVSFLSGKFMALQLGADVVTVEEVATASAMEKEFVTGVARHMARG